MSRVAVILFCFQTNESLLSGTLLLQIFSQSLLFQVKHIYLKKCNCSSADCLYPLFMTVVLPSPHPSLHSYSATLTSYSEPADRSAKHGEGTRASSLKLWHSQRATLDSGLYRLDENMAASTHSLNKIPEPSSTHHYSHPTPLYLMPRPNSVAGKSIP